MTTVAYIANSFPSPVEPYVMDEISELRRRGVQVICCSAERVSPDRLSDEERSFHQETRYLRPVLPSLGKLGRVLASKGEELTPVLQAAREESATRKKRLRTFAHTLLGAALAHELRSADVDHIHAHHGYYASWMALIASRLLGVGFSFTLHGSDLLLHENLLGTKLRFCRFCMTVSDYNRDYILQKFPRTSAAKVLVQRLGVDVDESAWSERPQPEHIPLLLSVGRLNGVKNHEFLIQACAALRNEGRAFRCSIAGDGPQRRYLAGLIRALELQGYIRLLGHVPRTTLFEIYPRADLVVLTSRSEGIPLALMEAMARGTLVLAPAITGIPELVRHKENGFLYQPGSILDFLESVRWILDRRSSLEHVRRAAVETISAQYNRQHNVAGFADRFLARLGGGKDRHEDSLLQQVQLSV